MLALLTPACTAMACMDTASKLCSEKSASADCKIRCLVASVPARTGNREGFARMFEISYIDRPAGHFIGYYFSAQAGGLCKLFGLQGISHASAFKDPVCARP